MNRSSRLAEKANTHYETAMLEAYGFMPTKENFLRFCHSAVHLPLIRSLLQLNDFGLAREEDAMSVDETQTKEQRSHCFRQLTEKSDKKLPRTTC